MKIKNVQKNGNKDIVITIRTTKENSDWMRDNNIRPSLLFNEAVEELRKTEIVQIQSG